MIFGSFIFGNTVLVTPAEWPMREAKYHYALQMMPLSLQTWPFGVNGNWKQRFYAVIDRRTTNHPLWF
jgi:hypothetical protein